MDRLFAKKILRARSQAEKYEQILHSTVVLAIAYDYGILGTEETRVLHSLVKVENRYKEIILIPKFGVQIKKDIWSDIQNLVLTEGSFAFPPVKNFELRVKDNQWAFWFQLLDNSSLAILMDAETHVSKSVLE